ncbi:tax1-binding protein 1 homolog isoform X4 [Vombatus ursinus]|uniref:UBZ1-type domain-containing protein n=1 Tax=Vombatus ursinus TaxID=29139 RepID=A0A4X2JSW3_VOMUR|nr:tax1-binding protein 1 homolog isoform X4 [Vombatus ursinus]XP_027727924.1 tax1-binding protein 1 homolog isoform X4 [Vombatus ursinus]
MTSFQEVPLSSTLQTSNFAHVIFQNVAKSYLPNAHLECHYTLTQYIHPHPKDWVGIFKVGWSTARDYYTFLWSPMPEHYVEGSTVNCLLSFQGYYLPNDDGEFYQFCYVTHKGEIRGASTPFQFRASSPVEELLTMEDEGNSDMLVVTTKAGLLEFKIEKTMKEKEELLKVTSVLEKETSQLREEVGRLEKELSSEKERGNQLLGENKGLVEASQNLKMENEELKKKHSEAASRVLQLEEDLVTVTQRAITKETELDSLKDKLKKGTLEKEQLECQLKTEKDEKELYKEDAAYLKEQLRKAEEQVQATRQEAVFLAKELSDAVSVRDQTMSELHSARLENEQVRSQLAEAVAELRVAVVKKQQEKTDPVEQELRREVEDLKLRLQMAADHYREKFRECQRLQKQVTRLSEQAKTGNQQKVTDASSNTETASGSPVNIKLAAAAVGLATSEMIPEVVTKGQVCEMTKEIAEKTEKYKKCKQLLLDERAKCSSYADELARLELKWKEQVKISEEAKLRLAEVEDQYKELKRRLESQAERVTEGQSAQQCQVSGASTEHSGPVPSVPNRRPVLQFGNPYAAQDIRDGADGAFYPDEIQRPPVRMFLWELEDNVVCSQPARNLSRPDGLEDPEDSNDDDENVLTAPEPPSQLLHAHGTGFCFDSSFDVHKKCPLCELMFPPNYDQSKFEEHVESHWKVCPMCSEQFPPDYDQHGFESHVQTHFDQNVLNFD